MKVLFILAFVIVFVVSQSTICDKGIVKDCYSVNVWKVKLPAEATSPCAGGETSLRYNTKSIDATVGVDFNMFFGIGILTGGPIVDNPSNTTYCDNIGYAKYNLSMVVSIDEPANDTNYVQTVTGKNAKLDSVYKYPTKALSELSQITLAQAAEIGKTLTKAGNGILQILMPSGPHVYHVKIDYIPYSSDSTPLCYLKFFLYSCYISNLGMKIGIGLGIGAGCVAVLCLCPCLVIVCLCCWCCGCKKKKKY